MLIINVFGIIINLIGASTRYIYGTTWRSIAEAKRYSFEEYLYGPKTDDQIDIDQHILVNIIVGLISIVTIVYLIKYCINLFY